MIDVAYNYLHFIRIFHFARNIYIINFGIQKLYTDTKYKNLLFYHFFRREPFRNLPVRKTFFDGSRLGIDVFN